VRGGQPILESPGRDPVFDALVWVACGDGSGVSPLLDAVARTLDYPGLLARTPEDRRQAVLDLLSRRSVLLLVDDVDRGDAGSCLSWPNCRGAVGRWWRPATPAK